MVTRFNWRNLVLGCLFAGIIAGFVYMGCNNLTFAQPINYGQVQTFHSWTQLGRATDISATTTSSSEALGTKAPVAIIYNTGTTWAYVSLSTSSGTVTEANGIPVPPARCVALNATSQTYINAIMGTGSATLNVSLGEGWPGPC